HVTAGVEEAPSQKCEKLLERGALVLQRDGVDEVFHPVRGDDRGVIAPGVGGEEPAAGDIQPHLGGEQRAPAVRAVDADRRFAVIDAHRDCRRRDWYRSRAIKISSSSPVRSSSSRVCVIRAWRTRRISARGRRFTNTTNRKPNLVS